VPASFAINSRRELPDPRRDRNIHAHFDHAHYPLLAFTAAGVDACFCLGETLMFGA